MFCTVTVCVRDNSERSMSLSWEHFPPSRRGNKREWVGWGRTDNEIIILHVSYDVKQKKKRFRLFYLFLSNRKRISRNEFSRNIASALILREICSVVWRKNVEILMNWSSLVFKIPHQFLLSECDKQTSKCSQSERLSEYVVGMGQHRSSASPQCVKLKHQVDERKITFQLQEFKYHTFGCWFCSFPLVDNFECLRKRKQYQTTSSSPDLQHKHPRRLPQPPETIPERTFECIFDLYNEWNVWKKFLLTLSLSQFVWRVSWEQNIVPEK